MRCLLSAWILGGILGWATLGLAVETERNYETLPSPMTATIERTVSYQGILKDNTGNPVGDGDYNLIFRIYDAASNGTLLWTSPQILIATKDGYFAALLGPIPLPFNIPYYLAIQVQGDTQMPQRQVMTMGPYSAVSDTANFAFAAPGSSNWYLNGDVLYTNGFKGLSRGNAGDSLYGDSTHTMINLGAFSKTGDPTATKKYSTISGGLDNRASADYAVIGGGSNNLAKGSYSFVGGGGYNEAETTYSTISGGSGNRTFEYGFIGGGEENLGVKYSSIGGGNDNMALGEYSVVSGGSQNEVHGLGDAVVGGVMNSSYGDWAFIGGGVENLAIGNRSAIVGGEGSVTNNPYTFVGGGGYNAVYGDCAAILGGRYNYITDTASVICGGAFNKVAGRYSTIGGGLYDTVTAILGGVASGRLNRAGDAATDTGAFIGGGYDNAAIAKASVVVGGSANTAQGGHSFIGGGWQNYAAASYSVVCGGSSNANSAGYSTILGGYADTMGTSGDYSLLYGTGVYNNNDYRVVFFDGNNYGSLNVNRDGRDGTVATHPIQVGTTTSNGNGAYLTAGGVWTNGSSRTFKENFTPYNGEELLRKISSLSITSYNYKNSTEKHIGPVAEEFVGAFDTGVIRESDNKRDDMYLSSGDVAGVALAGVQELLKQNNELKADNDNMKKLIENLERRLSEIERNR